MEYVFNLLSGVNITSRGLAHLVFFLVALVVAIFSLIFFFHWRKYGMGGKVLALTELCYIVVAVGLLALAFINIS